jgi:phospholipid/cholesterol/gamma-HCH transport system permease protein
LDEWARRTVREIQDFVLFLRATAYATVSRPFYIRDLVNQLDYIGIGTLAVVVLTGFFTGAAVALQTGTTLDRFGARPVVGRIVSASVVREVGPVFTTLMMAGRVGSGIAAELGSMAVTEQINALRALGTDPIRKLVVPRVLAGLYMAPVLTVVYDVAAMVGGWLATVYGLRVAASTYWTSVTDVLYPEDVWMGLLKPLVLGGIVVTIACYVGLRTRGGTQGVGRGTTQVVVVTSAAIIAADFFLSRLFITLFY